jgi:hypothetical protein
MSHGHKMLEYNFGICTGKKIPIRTSFSAFWLEDLGVQVSYFVHEVFMAVRLVLPLFQTIHTNTRM